MVTVLQLAGIVHAADIALTLNNAGLLYYGSGRGYYSVTVGSLVEVIFSSGHPALPAVVTVLVVLAMAVAIAGAVRLRERPTAPLLLTALLGGDIVARLTMHLAFGTNFPMSRAALQLAPLCVVLFAYALDEHAAYRPAWSLGALCLLALPIQQLRTLNLERVLNDTMLTIPPSFMDRIHALQDGSGRPLLVSATGQFPEAWAFHGLSREEPIIPLRHEPRPEDPDDARIITRSQLPLYQEGYHVVDSSAAGDVLLLFRNTPGVLTLRREYVRTDMKGTDEFPGLQLPTDIGQRRSFLRVTGRISSVLSGEETLLVTEARDSSGQNTRYDAVSLRFTWLHYKGGALDAMYFLPAGAGGERLAYWYNPARRLLHLEGLRVRLYEEEAE